MSDFGFDPSTAFLAALAPLQILLVHPLVGAGSAFGLAAFALFVRRDAIVLVTTPALAVIALPPPIVAARRALGAHPFALTIASVMLGANRGLRAIRSAGRLCAWRSKACGRACVARLRPGGSWRDPANLRRFAVARGNSGSSER